MSTNNVIYITDCYLDTNTVKTYIKMGDDYLLHRRFMVGKGPDFEKFKKIKRLTSILLNKECLLEDVDFKEVKELLNKLTY